MLSALPIAGLLFAAAVTGASLPATATDAPNTPPTSCASGVQIFVARGSSEKSHEGRIAPIDHTIAESIPGSSITAVDYPADINAVKYLFSVRKGVTRLTKLIEEYHKHCPRGKIVLVGFSQGAHVVGDTLCGASSFPILRTKPIDSIYNKNVIATLMFGDPTRAKNQGWNVGTVTDRDGYFPRHKNTACSPYSQSMRSWCDQKDRWCDKHAPGGTDRSVHSTYQIKYRNEAKDFVLKQWNLNVRSVS
ncbi:uncharacterized protein PgNI_05090 [Pyricularia grisea]|uniref:Acetylxylan esterase n=1 Tax=Pyricularia grisea TaxID=148305 RepID=A0A6P8BCI6_PYRGI|nr:uncharacterized protein PgNI_05090 [Pyricularia grisea]TLD13412.1 hypothetical protein PgNI_05090 [Pyricularia grisea]